MKNLLAILIIGSASFASVARADSSFTLSLNPTTLTVKKGEKGVVKVRIVPGTGFHMNKDYPTALSLTPLAGLVLEKARLTAKDATRFEEAGAEFDVSVTADAAGKKTLDGEIKFAVCSANSCDPKKEKLSFPIDVR